MSTVTKYYCDKCGKEVGKDELCATQISLDPYNPYSTQCKKFDRVSSYKEYCVECLEKIGFVKIVVKEGKKTIEPTTAEKLYDIISQIAFEARE